MSHNPDGNQSIGALAASRPASIPIFERLGLDFCCRGSRAFAEACRERGIDPDTVRREIDDAEAHTPSPPDRDWARASIVELADHIEQTHHVYAREAFARLASIVPRVVAVHSETHPELRELADLIEELRQDMHDHFIREERVLFPWLRRLERHSEIHTGPPWSVQRPISCMEHDHDAVAACFRRMRDLTHGFAPPAGACASYAAVLHTLADLERDTHVHIHKENNILFPAGMRAEERAAGSAAPRSVG